MFRKYLIIILAVFIWQLINAGAVLATYKIPKDVLNEAGGASNSDNYKVVHNLGESVIGSSSSLNYKLNSGFLQPDKAVLIFTISTNTANLGTLTTGSVNTANVTLTTSTSGINGYAVQAYDNTTPGIANGLLDGGKKISDATTPDTFVNNPGAGTEHYGIIVAGTHADAGYASGAKTNSLDDVTNVNIASYTDFIASDSQTVIFRASITDVSPAGANYGAIATFICTASF